MYQNLFLFRTQNSYLYYCIICILYEYEGKYYKALKPVCNNFNNVDSNLKVTIMYSFQHFQYTIIATINDVKFYVTIAPVNELTTNNK